jgi:hypothetical protein
LLRLLRLLRLLWLLLILLLGAKLAVYASFKTKAANSKGIFRDRSKGMATGTV